MTAPQQTAPDGGDGIVGALADALVAHWERVMVEPPGKWLESRARIYAEALAPTVARLIEDAVAVRLAGVEALADEWVEAERAADDYGPRSAFTGYDCAEMLRERLNAPQTPGNGPLSDSGASGGVPGRSEGDEAASEEKR